MTEWKSISGAPRFVKIIGMNDVGWIGRTWLEVRKDGTEAWVRMDGSAWEPTSYIDMPTLPERMWPGNRPGEDGRR